MAAKSAPRDDVAKASGEPIARWTRIPPDERAEVHYREWYACGRIPEGSILAKWVGTLGGVASGCRFEASVGDMPRELSPKPGCPISTKAFRHYAIHAHLPTSDGALYVILEPIKGGEE